jgi:spore maturation protein CgeB
MKVKVVIVGSNNSWALEKYYQKHLKEQNFDCTIFNVPDFFQLNSIIKKVRYKIGDASIYNTVNKELLAYCSLHKPNIVWIFKGVEIFPSTLLTLKKNGHFLANYNPDHPYIRTSIAHGGKNIPDSVPIFDLHFSYREDLAKKIYSDFGIKTVRLPFGFEISSNNFLEASSQKEIQKICFVGTPDKKRSIELDEFAKLGFKIDVYSLTYPFKSILTKNKNIQLFPVVLKQDFWNTLYKYRVQINFLRQHNIGSHNQRTFEVPGIGGILLTPYSEEQNSFFEDKSEIFLYQNLKHANDLMEELITMPQTIANDIRENARKAAIKKKYSYKDRATIVANTFNAIN